MRSVTRRALEANSLYYGDCLDWMEQWDDDSVDLIYLDPPFNSTANYSILFGESGGGAQYRAFEDTWTWDRAAADRCAMFEAAAARPAHHAIVGLRRILGSSGMLAYLSYMAERLEQMRRILKPTGSLYLHCDPTASHYLKVLMDAVFGSGRFFTEIIWKRTSAHSDARQGRRQYGRVHDSLLVYTKSEDWTWNPLYTDYDQDYVDQSYRHVEPETGRRYRLDNLTGPGGAAKGNPEYEVLGVTRHWRYSRERMAELIAQGRVVQTSPGAVPAYKRYFDEMPGVPLQDIWTDIKPIGSRARERLGYPTQKPLALLDRIVKASSNPDDLVLDPFCGCGTTVEAAQRLGRRWIGVDISAFAIDLIRDQRLQDRSIPAYGIPADLESARKLAAERPFDFEAWAVTRLPGFAPNIQQRGDGGVDGRATLLHPPDGGALRLALAQVKGGRFNLSALRDFIGVARRDRAALGCYVSVDPVDTRAARAAVANEGTVTVAGYRYPRIQLWSIADYFAGRRPELPQMTNPYTGKPLQPTLV